MTGWLPLFLMSMVVAVNLWLAARRDELAGLFTESFGRSPVDISTIILASWFGSRGRFGGMIRSIACPHSGGVMQVTVSRMISAGAFTAIVVGALTVGYVTGTAAQPIKPPTILSGDDIRFQVSPIPQSSAGGSVEGVFQVRIDGKWVTAKVQDHLIPQRGVKPLE
jgi:hypothetical protein